MHAQRAIWHAAGDHALAVRLLQKAQRLDSQARYSALLEAAEEALGQARSAVLCCMRL